MVKKAQISFVCITMSILFCVFTIIGGILYYISSTNKLNNIEHILDETARSFILPEGTGIHSQTIIAQIKDSTHRPSSQVNDIWFDSQTFTEEQVNIVIKTAISKVQELGNVGNIYYKFYNFDNIPNLDGSIFVAVDATDTITIFTNNYLKTLFTLLITYGLLFLVVMKLSWWALKPLRTSLETQQQFFANASHELKTPVSIISANVEVISEENSSQWTSNIKSQTERMSLLIEDMLSIAKLDENNYEIFNEKLDLSQIILENALYFDTVAYEKGKTLTLNIQPNIIHTCDKNSVVKIVNTLLDNAVKHASENGDIILDLKKENNKIILSVFNTGSEVPDKDSNKVFERFYRADSSRARSTGGSGLGLAIAKSISNANKWKLTAESKLNESMTITLIF